MVDEKQNKPKNSDKANAGGNFQMRGQYVKDLSMESPNSPASLLRTKNDSNVELGFDLSVTPLKDGLYEVVQQVTARAISENTTLFIVELSYAGIFQLNDIPEDQIKRVLMIDCAFILFPFTRRVIADITRDAGFPSLLLEPVDFRNLFMESEKNGKNEKK